jgi:hypothetical protein
MAYIGDLMNIFIISKFQLMASTLFPRTKKMPKYDF